MKAGVPSSAPEPFRSAVSSLLATVVRPEARVERIRPPQRLAPWTFAVAIDVTTPTTEGATGRLVVLYDPESKIDAFSVGEAQLGANRAHAGFLRVNVLKNRQVEAFAKTYGILQVPTVLFFARPGKLVQKLVGFADQDTVAQAALNAARGLVVVQ